MRPRSRRKLLIVRYLTWSVLATACITAAVLLLDRNSQGKYLPGSAVGGVTSDLDRRLPDDRPELRFVDAAPEAGIDFRHFQAKRTTQLPEDMGSGAAWGDYDNDGDWDLYLVDIAHPIGDEEGTAGGARLYRNDGEGSFSDVTKDSGVGFRGLGMGAAWADFNADGHLDLVVTAYQRLTLYRGNGDGTFTDVTEQAGLGGYEGFWTGASWADYDRDGAVDLYICGYVRYDFRPEYLGRGATQYTQVIPFTLNPSSYKPERNLLFHNAGNGRFEEVAAQAGVTNIEGRSLSASWSDFDLDGYLDLYVANDVSDNVLYRSRGDGSFEDVSHAAWAADYRGAMGLAVGDYDNDGDNDMFVTHWVAQENGLLWNVILSEGDASPDTQLKFTDVADLMGLGQLSLNDIGWGTSFVDFDLDGQLDLFIANGSTFERKDDGSRLVPMRSRVFWQRSSEAGFFDLSEVSGPPFAEPRVSRGAAFADYDNDGDVDVLVVNHQDAPWLLRNESSTQNHWLKVRPECGAEPIACLGATVEIETAAAKQRRDVGSQSSYLSQNAPEAHFGIGRDDVVKKIVVRFPSGVVRELENVQPNQTIRVRE